MSPPSSFTVTPATLADIPAAVDLFFEAFNDKNYWEPIFPSTPEGRGFFAKGYERFIKSEPGRQKARLFVGRDENGRVVGMALCWIIEPEERELKPWQERWPAPVAGQTPERLDDFFGRMAAKHNRVMGEEAHIFVEIVATAESVRGKGLGAQLLQPAADMADDLGWPCYLDATPKAVSLYKRCGYVAHDTGDLPGEAVSMRRPTKDERTRADAGAGQDS